MKVLIFNATGSAEPIGKLLSQARFTVESSETLDRTLHLLTVDHYVAVLIQYSGAFSVLQRMVEKVLSHPCKALRAVVTNNQSGIERAQLLHAGLDHYYIQPFYHSQLIAEVCLHAYRADERIAPDVRTERFILNPLMRTVVFDSQEVPDLTRTEFDLLAVLLKRRGLVLSRLTLWEEVWGYQEYPAANTIDVHLNRLRKKLPKPAGELIRTIYGVGYRMGKNA